MPGPWIDDKTNVNWLKEQIYDEGSIFEIRGYDAAKKPQGVILIEVTDGGSPDVHRSRLGIRILAASDRDLNWWMKYGPGKRLKNIGILHLCNEEVKGCQHFKLNEEEEFHTDGIRLITLDDVIKRSVKWWSEEPGKAMFEAARFRLLRERGLEEPPEGEIQKQTSVERLKFGAHVTPQENSEVTAEEGVKGKRKELLASPAQAAVSKTESSKAEPGEPEKGETEMIAENVEHLLGTGQKMDPDEAGHEDTASSFESGSSRRKQAKKRRSKKKRRQKETSGEVLRAGSSNPKVKKDGEMYAESTGSQGVRRCRGTAKNQERERHGRKEIGVRKMKTVRGREAGQEEKVVPPVKKEKVGRKLIGRASEWNRGSKRVLKT